MLRCLYLEQQEQSFTLLYLPLVTSVLPTVLCRAERCGYLPHLLRVDPEHPCLWLHAGGLGALLLLLACTAGGQADGTQACACTGGYRVSSGGRRATDDAT
jgi:hypothetical protein